MNNINSFIYRKNTFMKNKRREDRTHSEFFLTKINIIFHNHNKTAKKIYFRTKTISKVKKKKKRKEKKRKAE